MQLEPPDTNVARRSVEHRHVRLQVENGSSVEQVDSLDGHTRGLDGHDAGERNAEWVRTTRRARRERPMLSTVEERPDLRPPTEDFVQVRDDPDMGKPLEVGETSEVRDRDMDQRVTPS